MAKLCNEMMKIYQEIFDEAYLLGRTSGSQGIFICPKAAFESYFEQKFSQEMESQVSHETFEPQVIAFDRYRAAVSNGDRI